MANAVAHRFGAALVVGGISAYNEDQNGQNTAKPLVHATAAAVCGSLPDILEPAFHPNHRQFFHSFGFAGLLGYGLYKLYQWQPQDEMNKLLKQAGFVVGGAYLVHLAMDATTPKSLPIV
ncbi:metal-dependent hydrolase [Sulfuriflexus sp.]|uniref:metal-dependent hydrolase n=1 Tax=Sulfuriflexus sp. TaxID=2015443 RepID=UPI0028CD66DF|nr:metal-dependent hydrolase [Sulfuriflexus sp.]MDT8405049.1 metal-dependent hydrolase [Sulfuriflexus sp.]